MGIEYYLGLEKEKRCGIMKRKKVGVDMAMLADIKGRIRKFNLSQNDSFLAILEALVNSIQSGSTNIHIEVIREAEEEILTKEKIRKIKGFKIIDDGEGFTKKNFEAFNTLDTTNKYHLGGKGVGRLSWLKVFEKINIESNFEENSNFYKRKFKFSTLNGIEDDEIVKSSVKSNKTKISLLNINSSYYKYLPKKKEDIEKKIVEYLFVYFWDENLKFNIFLKDYNNSINLRKVFNDMYKNKVHEFDFKIENDENINLEFKGLYYFSDVYRKNSVVFTAHTRYVEEYNFKLIEEKFADGYLKCFISGKYLDENVNDERTGFIFPRTGERLILTSEVIIDNLELKLKDEFKEYFQNIKKKKENRMNQYLKENPSYKYLNELFPEIVEDIKINESNVEITKKLTVKKIEIQEDVRKEVKGIKSYDEYKEKREEIEKKTQKLNSMDLSSYVIHRKIIIELYKKFLEFKDEEQKYYQEKDIHNIFFPYKSDISEIKFDEHNLWLIDDRLSFHDFIVSDMPMTQSKKTIGSEIYKRPDILTWNKMELFQGKENEIYIIEFKRPWRNDYNDDDPLDYNGNPIDQILNYADDIREKRVRNYNGREIKINENETIYGYLIADITPKLLKFAKRHSMIASADNESFYYYFNEEKVFLEIHSLEKVIQNAEKRNYAFFEKLGIK